MTVFDILYSFFMSLIIAVCIYQIGDINKRLTHLESVTFGSSRCVK